jgi:palmitoyltransferase
MSLCAVNFLAWFALSILLGSALWALASNVYTIEGWEIERHEVLLRRTKRNGGYLNRLDGSRMRLVKHEFPYDIGIFSNLCQGMGSSNPLIWFWPLAISPSLESGLRFETNVFESKLQFCRETNHEY